MVYVFLAFVLFVSLLLCATIALNWWVGLGALRGPMGATAVRAWTLRSSSSSSRAASAPACRRPAGCRPAPTKALTTLLLVLLLIVWLIVLALTAALKVGNDGRRPAGGKARRRQITLRTPCTPTAWQPE